MILMKTTQAIEKGTKCIHEHYDTRNDLSEYSANIK